MSHGLPEVTLQSTQHEVILYGLQEVTSERKLISHDLSIKSMVLITQNGKNSLSTLIV